jgi:uncharacterized protein Usg
VPRRTPGRVRERTAGDAEREQIMKRTDPDFRRQLDGYSLATAEILYRMPDARNLLQTYIWQDYDLAPRFPNLMKFLNFWTHELDGPIHSVRLAHARLLRPAEFRYAGHELTIH